MSCRFKDFKGTDWTLHLTVGNVAAVKRETGVNLALSSKDNSWVEMLFGDPEKLAALLWVLCEEQANRTDITPEEFASRFDGATLEAAGDALAQAIAGFFPRSKMAAAIQTGMPDLMRKADEKGVAEINRILSTGSLSATSSPESSASIPEG